VFFGLALVKINIYVYCNLEIDYCNLEIDWLIFNACFRSISAIPWTWTWNLSCQGKKYSY
jgi:hypothetical protein